MKSVPRATKRNGPARITPRPLLWSPINAGPAVIDGEVVASAVDGTTDFPCCKMS